jgi:hypothetical protein
MGVYRYGRRRRDEKSNDRIGDYDASFDAVSPAPAGADTSQ